MLSVRLVTADHCQTEPAAGWDVCYSEFRGRNASTAPVIRVFGATADGTKACVHVHGVLPYLYVPFDGSGSAATAAHQLAAGLDRALVLSTGGGRQSSALHVHKVVLVAGVPFYGYHKKSHLFFKIFLYNPRMVSKAAELLQSGAVLHRSYQPHEVHIPYLLQFFIDFNLQGMNMIHVSSYKVRTQPGTESSDASGLQPVSSCALEIDVHAAHILNRTQDAGAGSGNPGLAAIWREERARRRQAGDGRDSQPTLEVQESRPAPRQASEIAALAALAARLAEQSQSQLEISSSELASQLDVSLPVECGDESTCAPANSLGLPELSQTATVSAPSSDREASPPAECDVDEQLVLEMSQRADSSVRLDSQDDSLAAALLCLLSPGGEERHPSQEQQEQDAQDAADELEMSQAVWSQHDRHLSPQRQQTRSDLKQQYGDAVASTSWDARTSHDVATKPSAVQTYSEEGCWSLPEESENSSSPPLPLSRQTTYRLPQLDGAGDEELPPEVKRVWRLGTTGRRLIPGSSSSGVGGAFKPVMSPRAPIGVAGPDGDGLCVRDTTRGPEDEEGVGDGTSKENSELRTTERADSEVVRLVDDDSAMRDSAIGSANESVFTGNRDDATAIVSDGNKPVENTMDDDVSVPERVNDSAMVETVESSSDAQVSDDQPMPERMAGTEMQEDDMVPRDIGDSTMLGESTAAVSEGAESGTAAKEDKADDTVADERGWSGEMGAGGGDTVVQEERLVANDCSMVNPNEMDCAGDESLAENMMNDETDGIEGNSEEILKDDTMTEENQENGIDEDGQNDGAQEATVADNNGNECTMAEESVADATMAEECPKDAAMAEETIRDDTMVEENPEASTLEEKSDDSTMLENVDESSMAEDSVSNAFAAADVNDASMVEASGKDITVEQKRKESALLEGSDVLMRVNDEALKGKDTEENIRLPSETLPDAVLERDDRDVQSAVTFSAEDRVSCANSGNLRQVDAVVIERNTSERLDQSSVEPSHTGTRDSIGPEEAPSRDGSTENTNRCAVVDDAKPTSALPPSTSCPPSTDSADMQAKHMLTSGTVETTSRLDSDQVPPEQSIPVASRRRVVSESDSELSVDSSYTSSVASVSVFGSPVVVLSPLQSDASKKTPKKPRRSGFRLSTKKYLRWRRDQRREREASSHGSHADETESAAGEHDERGGHDAISLAGSAVSESSRTESEPSRYSRRSVDLGVAWLTLPNGRSEEDVWRAVSAAVVVPQEERAVCERAAAGCDSVSTLLDVVRDSTRSPSKGQSSSVRGSSHSPSKGQSKDDTMCTQEESGGPPPEKRTAPVVKKLSYTEKLLARIGIDLNPTVRVERLSLQTLSKPQKPTGDLFKLRLSRNANKLSLSRSLAERAKTSGMAETSHLTATARIAKASLDLAKRIVRSPKKSGLSHPQMRITNTSPVKTKSTSSPSKARAVASSPVAARKVPLSITVSPQKRPGGEIASQPSKKARVKITPLRPPSKTQPKKPSASKASPTAIIGGKSRPNRPPQKTGSSNVEVLHCPRVNLIWDGHNFVRPPSPKPAEGSAEKAPERAASAIPPSGEEMGASASGKSREKDCSPVSEIPLTSKSGEPATTGSPGKRVRKPRPKRPRTYVAKKKTTSPLVRVGPVLSPSGMIVPGTETVRPVAPLVNNPNSWDDHLAQNVGWMGFADCDVPADEVEDVKPVFDSPVSKPALTSPMDSPVMPLQVELTVPPSPQPSAAQPSCPVSRATATPRNLFSSPVSRPPVITGETGITPSGQKKYTLAQSNDGSMIAVELPPQAQSQPPQPPQRQPQPTQPSVPPRLPPPQSLPSQAPAPGAHPLTPLAGRRLLVGSLEVTVGTGQPPVIAVRRLTEGDIRPLTPAEINDVHVALRNALQVRGLGPSAGELRHPPVVARVAVRPNTNPPGHGPSQQIHKHLEQQLQEARRREAAVALQVKQLQQQQQLQKQQEQQRLHQLEQQRLHQLEQQRLHQLHQLQQQRRHQQAQQQQQQQQQQQGARSRPQLQRPTPMVMIHHHGNIPVRYGTAAVHGPGAGSKFIVRITPSNAASTQGASFTTMQSRMPIAGTIVVGARMPCPPQPNLPQQQREPLSTAGSAPVRSQHPPRSTSPVSYMAADSTSAEETASRAVPAVMQSQAPHTPAGLEKSSDQRSRPSDSAAGGSAPIAAAAAAASSGSSSAQSTPEIVVDWCNQRVKTYGNTPAASHPTRGVLTSHQQRLSGAGEKERSQPRSESGKSSEGRSPAGRRDGDMMSLLNSNNQRTTAEEEDSMMRMGFLSCSSADNSGEVSPPVPATPRRQRRASESTSRNTPAGSGASDEGGDRRSSSSRPGRVSPVQRVLSSPELFEPPDAAVSSSESDPDDLLVESPISPRLSSATRVSNVTARSSSVSRATVTSAVNTFRSTNATSVSRSDSQRANAIRIRDLLSTQESPLSQAWSFGGQSPGVSNDNAGSTQDSRSGQRSFPSSPGRQVARRGSIQQSPGRQMARRGSIQQSPGRQVARRGSIHQSAGRQRTSQGSIQQSPSRQRARRGGSSGAKRSAGPSRDTGTPPVETFGAEVLIPVGGEVVPPQRRAFQPSNQSASFSVGDGRVGTLTPSPRVTSVRSVGTPVVGWSSSVGVPTLDNLVARPRGRVVTIGRGTGRNRYSAINVVTARAQGSPSVPPSPARSRPTGVTHAATSGSRRRVADNVSQRGSGIQLRIADVTSLAEDPRRNEAANRPGNVPGRPVTAVAAADDDDGDEITMVFDSSQRPVEVVDIEDSSDEDATVNDTTPVLNDPAVQTTASVAETAGCSARTSSSDDQMAESRGPIRESSDELEQRRNPSAESSRSNDSTGQARSTCNSLRSLRLVRKAGNRGGQVGQPASQNVAPEGSGTNADNETTHEASMHQFFEALTAGAKEVLERLADVGTRQSSPPTTQSVTSTPASAADGGSQSSSCVRSKDSDSSTDRSTGMSDENASTQGSKESGGNHRPTSDDGSSKELSNISSSPVNREQGDADPSSPGNSVVDGEDCDESAYLPLRMSCVYDGDTSVVAGESSRASSPFIRVGSGQEIPKPASPIDRTQSEAREDDELASAGFGDSGPGSAGFDGDRAGSADSLFDMIETIDQGSSVSAQSPFQVASTDRVPSPAPSPSGSMVRSPAALSPNGANADDAEQTPKTSGVEESSSLAKRGPSESSTEQENAAAVESESSTVSVQKPAAVEGGGQSDPSCKERGVCSDVDDIPEPSNDVTTKPRSPPSFTGMETLNNSDMFNDSLDAYSLDAIMDPTQDSTPQQRNLETTEKQTGQSAPEIKVTQGASEEQKQCLGKESDLPMAEDAASTACDELSVVVSDSTRDDLSVVSEQAAMSLPTKQDETEHTERSEAELVPEQHANTCAAVTNSSDNGLFESGPATQKEVLEADELTRTEMPATVAEKPAEKETVPGSEPSSKDESACPESGAPQRESRQSLDELLDEAERELDGPQISDAKEDSHSSRRDVSDVKRGESSSCRLAGATVPEDATGFRGGTTCLLDTDAKMITVQDKDVLGSQGASSASTPGGRNSPDGQDFCEAPLVSAGRDSSSSSAGLKASGKSERKDMPGPDAAPVGQPEESTEHHDQPDRPNRNPGFEESTPRCSTTAGRVCLLLPPPPSVDSVMTSLRAQGLPSAPTRPVLGAGRGDTAPLPPFEGTFQSGGLRHWRTVAAAVGAGAEVADVTALVSALEEGGGAALLASRQRCTLTPARPPPSYASVAAWLSGRQNQPRPEPDSSDSEDSDTTSEADEEDCDEPEKKHTTADGPSSVSTPLAVPSASGRPPSVLRVTPVCSEPAVRRSASYGTVTSVLTPVRRKPTKRRRLVPPPPPLPGPSGSVQTPADVGRRSRLERLVEVEEGGERQSAEGGMAVSGGRSASGEAESESGASGQTGGESEEVAAVALAGSSSQETKFSGSSSGRGSRQEKHPVPVTADRDLTSPLLPSSVRREMTSPLEPSLLISPSFGIQRANSTDNSFGFKMDLDNLQDAQCSHEYQYLTCLSLEVHALTRGDLRPDPEHDAVVAVFYHITDDVPDNWVRPREASGCIVADAASVAAEAAGSRRHLLSNTGLTGLNVRYVIDEHALLDALVELVNMADPDILLGWEVQQLSWGYLLERADCLGRPLTAALSRLPLSERASRAAADADVYGSEHTSEIHLAGRIVLNVWRLLRPEVALYSYTFENIAYHVLHQRLPEFTFRQLTEWWQHKSPVNRWRVAEYYMVRSRGTLQILSRLDIIGRTAELARLFGIQFFDVISRGSQFRVESMMLRVAKPRNLVPVSPSVQQRAAARAPEFLPLILEPESKMFTDPVVVLDFQSLYPSMIIAYNYCFSTCLGRVEHLGQRGAFPMGCTALNVPPAVLSRLLERDQVHVSPCGAAFVTRECRRGVLPDMLEEILNTRIMVKKAMKEHKDQPAVRRVLDFKQLGLKLIANVTYGYTAANFSGRMPCVEVGDSVVSKGRETLERAIRTIESRPEWAAKVVYGDTDSLFILLKGRTRAEAFQLGEEMAAVVTADNPDPVKLKFEEVYQPCILQTKKRYVGYMYETPDQQKPVYDAKGIETVRRDGCPAVAKMLEKSLRLLFSTHDVSAVRRYVTGQFEKFHRDAVSTADLLFAREYRGRAGYQPGACVPALRIADRLVRVDRRAEPRVGQRVPYAVVYGAPGLPLIDLVRSPAELRADPGLRLNAEYYVSRVVAPPLQRCLGLLGVDVMSWYASVPRRLRLPPPQAAAAAATISRYFAGRSCAVCARASAGPVCAECAARPLRTRLTLQDSARRRERALAAVNQVCAGCCGQPAGVPVACVSVDCPVLWSRTGAERQAEAVSHLREVLQLL